jgi:hypothetical protein
MAGSLHDLKSQVTGSKVFNQSMFADVDCNVVLDDRDSPPFDSEWVRVDRLVKSTQRDIRLGEDQWKLIDEVRKIAFLQTAKFVGQHEICGYISDDFGLIATALALCYDDEWLTALWTSYKGGKIPCGDLEPVKGGLQAAI